MKSPTSAQTPQLDLTSGVLLIDASTLAGFNKCNRYAYFYRMRKRESAAFAAGRTFGTIIHGALEIANRNPTLHPNEVRALQLPYLEKEFTTHSFPDGDHRNLQYAIDVLDAYVTAYGTDTMTTLLNERGEPLIEASFAVPLFNYMVNIPKHPLDKATVVVCWSGKIDRVVRFADGRFGHLDYKTTAMGGSTFFTEFELSTAQLGYAWALRNAMHINNDMFAISAIVCRKPTKTGKGIECLFQVFPVTNELLDEWCDNTVATIQDFIACALHNQWQYNSESCCGKYGVCPYHDICVMPHCNREAMLQSNFYTDVTWSPLKH